MNIEHLKLFVRLSVTCNISMAGKEFGLSPAVASSHINKLESHLGVRLLHRTTRKVSLTEDGVSFLPYAEDVLASVEAARASLGVGNAIPQGTVRVTAPASFGRMHLIPALKGFLHRYPELKVDFRFSDTVVDLVEGGFDIAIRNGELKTSSLIARKLASDRRIVCASPAYLDEYGIPQVPQDLENHHVVNLIGLDHWVFKKANETIGIKTKGRFAADNGDAVREACVDGVGIAMGSTWSMYKELQAGSLVQILAEYPLVSHTAVWAVYPSSRLLAPKVRAFIEYYSETFGSIPYWERELATQR